MHLNAKAFKCAILRGDYLAGRVGGGGGGGGFLHRNLRLILIKKITCILPFWGTVLLIIR